MIRRSRGTLEFMQRTTGWDVRSQIRFMNESGRDVSSIISPDWCPIGPSEPYVPQCELTPWLPQSRCILEDIPSWSKDFWMTQEIGSVYKNRTLLKKVYNTLIKRDEEEFYKEYCPIKWCYEDEIIWTYLDETLDKFKSEDNFSFCLGNFALSIETVRPTIMRRAKKYGMEVRSPRYKRVILWARYSFLQSTYSGRCTINYIRYMGEKALRYGIPSYPLRIELILK